MSTNKERIENLEAGFGDLQTKFDHQWWQWLRRAYHEEGKVGTWGIFVEELWSRFGPTGCEDFDEAL